jgi:hypothetical protein
VKPDVIPVLPVDTLTVRPWPDPVIDQLGHDPRSRYVETYWLGILGPSTTWLLRRIVAGFDELGGTGDGCYALDLAETARCLGLGERRGRSSPLARALSRLVQFDMAVLDGDGSLAVRRKVPPLTRRQVVRLPASLQASHQALVEADLRVPAAERLRRQGERLALTLLELGEDAEAAEQQLLRWQFHPALVRHAVPWAVDRHRERGGLRSIAGDDAA